MVSARELVDLERQGWQALSVVVAYRATARRSGSTYAALCNSTYRRTEGRWRLALHQQTPL